MQKEECRMKKEVKSSKRSNIQAPEKFQGPNINGRIWDLDVGASLVLASLDFGPSRRLVPPLAIPGSDTLGF
jgi:hypothetical protein